MTSGRAYRPRELRRWNGTPLRAAPRDREFGCPCVRASSREVADLASPEAIAGDLRDDAVHFVGAARVRAVLNHARLGALRDEPLVVNTVHRLEPHRIVEADRLVREVEDRLPRAVVAQQPARRRRGTRVAEAEQVLDLRAAEAVDALVVVADDRQVALRAASSFTSSNCTWFVSGTRPRAASGSGPALRAHVRGRSRSNPQREADLRAEVHAAVRTAASGRARTRAFDLGGGAVLFRRSGRGREALGHATYCSGVTSSSRARSNTSPVPAGACPGAERG